MRLTLLGVGTTGDLLPLAILGAELQRRGHEVQVATYANFAPLLAEYRLTHRIVPGESRRILTKQSRLGETFLPVRLLRMLRRAPLVRTFLFRLADAFLEASRNADGIIFVTTAAFGASIGEGLRIPSVHLAFAPLRPVLASLPYRGVFNEWRRLRLGLPKLPWGPLFDRPGQPLLYGFSPHACAAGPMTTGYLQPPVPREYVPPPDLDAFLRAGPAPIYVGFGSMICADPAQTLHAVRHAMDLLSIRVVLQRGWAELSPPSARPDLFVTDSIPHAWLFPRMQVIVHHGGNGTVGAALAAGIPQVIIPHVADQPFWASRMAALGVAPKPLPNRRLTGPRLADRLSQALNNAAMRQRATQLADRLRSEDGPGQAASFIEQNIGVQISALAGH